MTGRATHGHTRGRGTTAEFRSWCAMKQRCHDANSTKFHLYGARGIVVCDRWRESFEDFLADVGARPSATHTLGRVDNNGNYEPGNVRWETLEEQANNRRNNRVIEHVGERLTLAQWAARLGMDASRLHSRLHRGWPVPLAFDPGIRRLPPGARIVSTETAARLLVLRDQQRARRAGRSA